MGTFTPASVGDLEALIPSFERSLRATNKAPKTIATYEEASAQLLRPARFMWSFRGPLTPFFREQRVRSGQQCASGHRRNSC